LIKRHQKICRILYWQRSKYSKNPCDLLVRTKEKTEEKQKEKHAAKRKKPTLICVASRDPE